MSDEVETRHDESPKILIVDDDKFLIDIYSTKFSEQGFEVMSAFSGEEALRKIEQGFKPELCLVDVIMPSMDGFEVVRRMRENNSLAQTSLIILSNLGQKEDIEKGLKSGADGYLVKANATPSEVVEKVRSIITNNQNT